MAKKKKVNKEELEKIIEEFEEMKYENPSFKRRFKVATKLIDSGRDDLAARAYSSLAAYSNNRDYSITWLKKAEKIWTDLGKGYYLTGVRSRRKDLEAERDRPLWHRLVFPFRSAPQKAA